MNKNELATQVALFSLVITLIGAFQLNILVPSEITAARNNM